MNNFISLESFQQNTKLKLNNEQAASSIPSAQISLEQKPDTVELSTVDNSNKSALQEELDKAKNQNGLIEKLTDSVKNLTGLGVGSKKIQEMINNGASEEEIKAALHKYRASNENAAQGLADVASSAGAVGTMFFVKQNLNIAQAKKFQINGASMMEEVAKEAAKSCGKGELVQKFANVIKSNKTPLVIGALAATFVGGLIKSNLLKLNRIGTKQYKPEITEDMDKIDAKIEKRRNKKAKKNANFRNFVSGSINGLTAPVLAVAGVVGAPIYAAVNSLSRYFIGTREDKGHKNLSGYVENLKASPITHIATAAAIAIPAVKSAKFNKVFDANLNKVVENIKNNDLVANLNNKTSYSQLEDAILGNEGIQSIIKSDLTTTEKIEALTKENIFAVKFKQICSGSDELTVALKEACPSSRTMDEAKALVKKTYGDAYTIKNQVGVGTVAETYLAVDKNGNEVAIKMIKKGISEEKILADKEKFLEIIDTLADKTPEEKAFLKANVENIADGVLAEVNLTNEMESAKKLAEVTKKAKLVKPVTVKDNIYVMEKADGISLQTFINSSSLKRRLEDEQWYANYYSKCLKENPNMADYYKNALTRAQESIKEIEEQLAKKPPELSKDETKKLYEAYQDVLVEQFSKVDKGGKIIHGDIHPGNIFIDVEALKRGDKQFLTLIDTGNTITQSSESALRFLNLTKYINDGDVDNIAAFVLEGAKLPQGMTLEKAQEEVSKALQEVLFDNKTHIGPMNNDTMLAVTDGIMQKLSIIPSDTQGNLLKSKASSEKSLDAFFESFVNSLGEKFRESAGDLIEKDSNEISKAQMAKMAGQFSAAMAELGTTAAKMPVKKKLQERINLKNLSPADRVKLKRSPGAPKKNSEEYLNYAIKQGKKLKDKEDLFSIFEEM